MASKSEAHFSRTNQGITPEAELWATAAGAAEQGGEDLRDADTAGISGSKQNAGVMLQASIKKQSGDDNLIN